MAKTIILDCQLKGIIASTHDNVIVNIGAENNGPDAWHMTDRWAQFQHCFNEEMRKYSGRHLRGSLYDYFSETVVITTYM